MSDATEQTPMTAVQAFLQAMDDAWGHDFESVMAAIVDLSAAEADWQSPAYAAETPEDGWPLPGTVRWQIAHIAHCKNHYADILAAGPAAPIPPIVPRVALDTLADEVATLKAAHDRERAALASLTDAQLPLPCGNRMTMAEFIAMAIRHDSWHAAQIALARRLYRTATAG